MKAAASRRRGHSRRTLGWQVYALDFADEDETRVVSVAVRRQDCSAGPCPIFGRLWLDDFSLQKR